MLGTARCWAESQQFGMSGMTWWRWECGERNVSWPGRNSLLHNLQKHMVGLVSSWCIEHAPGKGPCPPLPPFYKSGMKATSVGGIHILDSAAKQNKPLVVSDNNGSYQLSGTWTLKGSKFPGKLSSAASPPPTTGMRSTSLVAGESSRVIHWKIRIGLEMDQLFYCD